MIEQLYVPDTNILVHQVRDDATGEYIRANYNLLAQATKPVISAVTQGELRSLSLQFGWGEAKNNQMNFLLTYFDNYPIASDDLYEAYALIDTISLRQGFSMGKNDLWIAATAHVLGVVLLTTDADFDHLPTTLVRCERIVL